MAEAKIMNQRVLALADQVDAHLMSLGDFSDIDPTDPYKGVPYFPDLSLEALERTRKKSDEIIAALEDIKKAEALSSYELLVLDMLEHFLRYNNYPAGFPTTEKHYYLNFDVTAYSFLLLALWPLLSGYPSDSRAHVDAHMALMADYPRFTGQVAEKLRQQAERGIYLAADAIDGAVHLLRAYAVPPHEHPASMDRPGTAATQAQIEREYAWFAQGRQNLLEAADFLNGADYRSKAPKQVGLFQYEGGPDYYRYLRRYHLGYDIPSRELHEMGLTLLGEIGEKQAAIRSRMGFSGEHDAFVHSLKGNPRFFAPSVDDLEQQLNSCLDKVNAVLPRYFHRLPKASCSAKPLPEAQSRSMTFGYYSPPSSVNAEGVYLFNAQGLEDKCQMTGPAIMAHELLPGHHFQIASVQENDALHPLLKKQMCTCVTEGWAEYASLFVQEQGLFEDLYDEYGRLEMDRMVSARLVADTGLNELGWRLDRAVAFLAANSFLNPAMARSEALRYATDIPAQCLPYKFGSIKMLELRDRFRTAKGTAHDPRDFHALILEVGSPPMDALERYVIREISVQKEIKHEESHSEN